MKTYTPRASDIQRAWLLIDADGVVLGRLAGQVAVLLRGKHKPQFAPHMDVGDNVVIVNAGKVAVHPNKIDSKRYYRHSGYPGGIRSRTLGEMLDRDPVAVVETAVRGMLPKNRLGRQVIGKLHVYAGPEHPHEAQQPEPYLVPGSRAAEAAGEEPLKAKPATADEPVAAEAADEPGESGAPGEPDAGGEEES